MRRRELLNKSKVKEDSNLSFSMRIDWYSLINLESNKGTKATNGWKVTDSLCLKTYLLQPVEMINLDQPLVIFHKEVVVKLIHQ